MPDSQTTPPREAFYGEHFVLSDCIGWAVGCLYEWENQKTIKLCKERGYLTERTHRCPNGDHWQAYALTKSGFERLRYLSEVSFKQTKQTHQWYAKKERQYRIAA